MYLKFINMMACNIAGEIPYIYKRVDCIISTSSGGQYIDTGIMSARDTGVYMRYKISAGSGGDGLIGQTFSPYRFGLGCYIGGTGFVFFSNSAYRINSTSYSPVLNTMYDVYFNYNNNGQVYATNENGVMYGSIFSIPEDINDPALSEQHIALGAVIYNNGVNTMKSINIYAARVTKGTEIIRDYVPCVRIADFKPGLYDKITDTFLTNAGSGEYMYV